jgi:hypothetical protein
MTSVRKFVCLNDKLELYLYLNDKFVCLNDKSKLYLYLNDKFVCLNDKFQEIRMKLWSI